MKNQPAARRGCFVTGTDTGIGKTLVSAALLQLLGAGGAQAAGCKPVAAGLDDGAVNADVRMLRLAGSVPLTDAEVGPCQLAEACAPHIAAQRAGQTLSRSALVNAVRHVGQRADWLVVEGVGGFRVPLGPDWDTADLAVDIGLPVLLVVGLRLGCLNHALLTADAVQHAGLKLAGWVASRIDTDMLHADANLDALCERLPAPCLGVLPWLPVPTPVAAAAALDAAHILSVLNDAMVATRC